MAKLTTKNELNGKFINLREVELDDATFILSLRTDEKKSRYLNKTENDLQKQIDYLKRYKTLDNEWYFIIENKKHEPLGTVRLYNYNPPCYTGGSWLMKEGVQPEETLEGDLLFKKFAFEIMQLEKSCFDVRKKNKKVVRYHQMWGATITGENDVDYFMELTKENYLNKKKTIYSLLK